MDIARLKELRIQEHLTQKELASMLHLDYKRYNHYETGRSEPDNDMLLSISDFFGVTTDYLLGRDSVDTYEKREPGTQTDAELSELNSIISRLSDGNRAKLRELAQLYLDSEQRKEENG